MKTTMMKHATLAALIAATLAGTVFLAVEVSALSVSYRRLNARR